MEVTRKRNQTTKVVFPLLNATSATQYYTTSAWTSMTNATKTVYFWSDDASVPTSSTIAANPVQLGSTGKWYLVISASEISANAQYMSIKLKSDQILEQTILIRITDYDASVNTISTPLTISAYQNFPQVTVSANLDKNNYTVSSGVVNTVTNPITVSAYQNFPQTQVSAINGGLFVGTSAYTNFPQVYVSANGDKTGYSITANTDKSGYSVIDGTINNVTNPVSVSAYSNFPNVIVSATTSPLSANIVQVVGTSLTTASNAVGGRLSVNVGAMSNNVIAAAAIATGAFTQSKFANDVTVRVSGYSNFPQVQVSGCTSAATIDITSAVNYQDGVWVDTLSGQAGTVVGVNGLFTNPSLTYSDALIIANSINVRRFRFRPGSNIILSANSDSWRYIGRAYLGLGGQSINDSVFENLELVSGTSIGKNAYFDNCSIGNITIDSSDFYNCNFNQTFTTVTNGVYVFKNCIDANPAGLSAPIFVCAPSATIAFRNYRGGLQLNEMSESNSIKLDGQGRVVIDSTCSGGDLTLRGFWQVTDNASGRVTITSSAKYDNTVPVTVSAYQNFPQVYVSAGTVNSVTNPVIVSAYQNFPSVNVSSVTDGTIVSADFGADYWNRVQLGIATTTAVSNVQATVNQISADTGSILIDTNEIQSKLPPGQIASQDDVASILQNTRFVAMVPSVVIVPVSGSAMYEIKVFFYNMSGTMENPDEEIAIEATSVRQLEFLTEFYDDISGTIPATISPTFGGNYYAMVSNEVGVWQTYFKFVNSAFTLPDQVVLDFTLNEKGKQLHYGRTITLFDEKPGTAELANTNTNKDVIARAIREFDASTISIGVNSIEKTIKDIIREPVTVSAYTNFPQVTVSANLDKTNYSVSSGIINSVINPVIVSAYRNFPEVQVSGINGGLYVGTSAYTNFPSVEVSAITNGTIVSADFGADYWTRVQQGLATTSQLSSSASTISNQIINVQNTVNQISANTNSISGLATSEQVTTVQNTVDAISAVTNQFTFNGSAVNAYSVNELSIEAVTVSAYENFPQVQVSGINGGLYVGTSAYQNFPLVGVSGTVLVSGGTIDSIKNSVVVSAYQNFPQVTVSANLDKNNYTVSSGVVNTVTNPITVSAYQNFPEVQVSGINTGISVSAEITLDSEQLKNAAVSAIDEKFIFSGTAVEAYSVNKLSIQSVTVSAYENFPQVQVSGINGGLFVGTSAYTNFPQVTVSANLDKTNYTISSGTVNNIINPVTVSAYQNFPSVEVSGTVKVSGGTIDTVTNSVVVSAYQNFPEVQVSGINTGVYGSVSAFMNMPQVTVSANLDKTNYTVSSGTINTVNNSVTVSAYQNFPSVNVSSMDIGAVISAGLATLTELSSMSAGIIEHGDISWSPSATVNEISAGCVIAIQDKFTFNSPGIVNAFVSGGLVSADPNTIVAALLSTTVDGKTFEELMEILLSMASGRITRVNNKFTYYKQDNTTALFTLESERSERTRL